MTVYVLVRYNYGAEIGAKILGVYSSEENAEAFLQYLRGYKPRSEFGDGLEIEPFSLDGPPLGH